MAPSDPTSGTADGHRSDDPTSSVWERSGRPTYERLVGERDVDVAVVGGGIVGLTTAAALARAGRSVVVLEARRIGDGTTGRSTAKITALQGTRYSTITRKHGADVARAYAEAQLRGAGWIREQVSSMDIDCHWEVRPAVTYATTEEGHRTVQEEAVAATAAGLPVITGRPVDVPYETTDSVWLDDQAQFSPVLYLDALAAEVDSSTDAAVHEGTRVTGISGRGPYRVRTGHGTVVARHVVVATLLPITDRGLFFARAKPVMSFSVAVDVDGEIPQSMSINVESPARSLRTAREGDRELLVVGGEGQGMARGPLPSTAVERLEAWTRQHFDVREVVSTWAAHDYSPADQLPWVGPASPLTPGVVTATGFQKWGITMGTAAALMLADNLTADEPAGWGAFDTKRLASNGWVEAAKVNADVAKRMVTDWVHPEQPAAPDGSGRRYRGGLVPKGESAGATGTEPVTVVCTHLGGVCRWNDSERTWDCPLHGSRFEADGTVLAGPAVKPLADGGARDGDAGEGGQAG